MRAETVATDLSLRAVQMHLAVRTHVRAPSLDHAFSMLVDGWRRGRNGAAVGAWPRSSIRTPRGQSRPSEAVRCHLQCVDDIDGTAGDAHLPHRGVCRGTSEP